MLSFPAIAERITKNKLMTADDSLNPWSKHNAGHVQTAVVIAARAIAERNEYVPTLRMVAGELLQIIWQMLTSMFHAAEARTQSSKLNRGSS